MSKTRQMSGEELETFLKNNTRKIDTIEDAKIVTWVNKVTGESETISSIEYVTNGKKMTGTFVIDGDGKWAIINKERREQAKQFFKDLRTRERMQEKFKQKARLKGFVQFNRKTNMELEYKLLTTAERDCYMKMVPFVTYYGKPFAINKVKMLNSDFAEIWNCSKTQASKRLSKFIEVGLIQKVKNPKSAQQSFYAPTEKFFFKGEWKSVDEFTVKAFQFTLETILNCLNKKVAQYVQENPKTKAKYPAALLNTMLPYVHFETGFVVHNYDESIFVPWEKETIAEALLRSPNFLKHVSINELRRKVNGKEVKKEDRNGKRLDGSGIDDDTFNLYVDWLVDVEAIHVVGAGDKRKFIVSPDLMFISSVEKHNEYMKTIKVFLQQASR